VKNLRATVDYAKLLSSDSLADEQPANDPKAGEGGGEVKKPEVGDLVQWEKDGTLRLEAPRRVRAIQDGELSSWIFLEGSDTGIPMGEITMVEKAVKPLVPPVLLEPKLSASEREWLRGPLSKETSYRLFVTGELASRELGKLIKLLQAQKAVLEDDDEEDQS
jgi:hypothetical protein